LFVRNIQRKDTVQKPDLLESVVAVDETQVIEYNLETKQITPKNSTFFEAKKV
jgi:hypothetical protein